MIARALVTAVAAIGLSSFATARDIKVIDGDSFKQGDTLMRLSNIDAPEIKEDSCDAEEALGYHARDHLEQILASGEPVIVLDAKQNDKYDRTLVRVSVNGKDVGEALIAMRLAVPWTGKQHDWCAKSPRA